MDKAKVKKWVYISCVTAAILIWLMYAILIIAINDGPSIVCNFVNNFLSSMNLSFRITEYNTNSIFYFMICFVSGLALPASSRMWIENNSSKKRSSKKWYVIKLFLYGLLWSILGSSSSSNIFLSFAIIFIVYTLGMFVYWLLHFEKKDKNNDLKKI